MNRGLTFLLLVTLLLIPSVQAVEFWTVKFYVWTSPLTYTVGKTANVPLYIKGLGILTDNYTLAVLPLSIDESQVAIDKYGQIVELRSGETQRIFIPITPLFSDDNGITLNIVVNSTVGLQKGCVPSPCSMEKTITISTGLASLPEFGLLGLLQMMLIAVVVLIVSKKIISY